MHALRPLRIAAAALLAGAAVAAHAETLSVEKLCVCWVTSLSADGHAAAGWITYDNATMRWTRKDGVKALGRNTSVIGVGGGTPRISRDGKVVAATILDSTGTFATSGRWTPAGGWLELDHPLPPDGGVMDLEDSAVFGMSGDGAVVTGLYWRPGQHDGSAHAFSWSAGTGMVGMPTDGGSSRIDGASADGRVLSGWEEDAATGQRLATVWVDGAKSSLDPQRFGSEANTVNGDGTILVGEAWNDASQHTEAAMWRWNGAAWDRQFLGLAKGGTVTSSSVPTGVSDDGSIVVGLYRDKFSKFSSGAFIWTAETGLVDASRWLQLNGVAIHPGKFTIMSVSAISADGRVLSFVGQDTVSPYATRTYLVTREATGK